MLRKTFILLLFFSLCLHPLFLKKISGEPIKRCPVTTLNFENGLLNNATNDVITDASGFTWFSTLSGLQRFNGYMLETIQPVVDGRTININYPVSFFALQDHHIWISCKDGILDYDPARNAFSRCVAYTSSANSPFAIIPLRETDEGVWCMHENRGIAMYDRRGKLIKQFSFFKEEINKILNPQQILFSDAVAVNKNFIFINNPVDHEILAIDTKQKKPSVFHFSDNVLSIACDHDRLYLLTSHDISAFDINSMKKIKTVENKTLTGENVLKGYLEVTGYGRLIASINNHLFEFRTKDLSYSEITDFRKGSVVLTGFIMKIYTDAFKRIWLLTNNDVKRIMDLDIPFSHFIYPNEKNNFVKALWYDEQKHVLIAGCFYGGIQLYDTIANPLWKKSLITSDVKNVISITRLTTDKYLIITFEKGWQLLDLATKQATPFVMSSSIQQQLQPTKVTFGNNVQRISDSVLLVPTEKNVFRCIFHGSALQSVEPLLKQTTDVSITCVEYATDKTLWIGSAKGIVYRLNINGGLATIEVPGGFVVRSIAQDDKHNVWIGTDKGMNVYNTKGILERRITTDNGLLNDCIYSILPVTSKAAVFCGTNMGLSYIAIDNSANIVKNFSKEMGLQENEFNTNSAFKTKEGKFYFGGINGITSFYPSALSVIKDAPLLNITRFIVNDSLLNPSATNWLHDTVHLSYKQNRLRFNLAALGLLNTNDYVYKYRMHGFENAWQTTNQPVGINYTLQPGSYTLEVAYSPTLSTGSIFNKSFVIIIDPPWWQTWWAKLIVVCIAVAVVVLIVKRYNHVKYKRKIQALQIQQGIQAEKERISRELHDDLGTSVNLLSYNASLLNEVQSTTELRLIGERIQSSSMDMLQALRETVWTLKQQTITTEDVWRRFKNFIAKFKDSYYTDISFSIDEEIAEARKLNYNTALNILRMLQEAVNNAVKHSDCNVITSRKKQEGRQISYIIEDNGKGFEYMTKQEMNEGNGLQNMAQRAKESGLELTIVSNKQQGTSVTIKV